jgi:hypothetical protein
MNDRANKLPGFTAQHSLSLGSAHHTSSLAETGGAGRVVPQYHFPSRTTCIKNESGWTICTECVTIFGHTYCHVIQAFMSSL